ncbi:MAG: ABC transporter permease [bacterium]|nr:ABC transporter permease [bacterium]
MIKNFLLTALRNLKRNRIYALLNILGLALGIGCSLVIYKVITYELSYDRFQSNYDDIYRVVRKNTYPDRVDYGQGLPHPFMSAVRDEMAFFDEVVTIDYAWGDQINRIDKNGNLYKYQFEEGLTFAEPQILNVLDLAIVAGNAEHTLKQPNQVVMSKSVVKKIFGVSEGYEKIVGQTINLANKKDITIGAIMEDPRKNTDFPFTMIMSYGTQKDYNDYFYDGKEWNSSSGSTQGYVVLKDKSKIPAINTAFHAFVEKHWNKEEASETEYFLQPLSDLHYNNEFFNFSSRAISKDLLLALGVIGLFLVITACINFVNLATAQAVKRSKEIGIRKSIGVTRQQLITQFLSETFMITLVSVLIALGISELLLQNLTPILGYQLSLDIWGQPQILLFIALLIIFVTILSGFYPAILLSRMEAVVALKNKITATRHGGGLSLRRALVIAQFTISQALIIGTLVVSAQMDYFLSKDLGFETEAIVSAYIPSNEEAKVRKLRTLLEESPDVKDVSFSLSLPTGSSNSHSNFNHALTNSERDYHGNFKAVDEHYMDLFGLELLAGRNFKSTDSMQLAIISKKVFDLLNLETYDEAIGMTLKTGFRSNKQIIGVMEDFHSKSLKEDMDYVFLIYDPELYYEVSVKMALDNNGIANTKSVLSHFENSFNEVYPEFIFDSNFYDEELAERYETEQRISSLFQIFSMIAIFIGCLGLYGLISFIATQRIKEIGVRKVLGATVWNIVNMFSKELVYLLIIAFIISAPVSYYFLNEWLDAFKYRIDIGTSYFLVSIIASLIVAIVTVGYKTYFTATMNPALSLKDE